MPPTAAYAWGSRYVPAANPVTVPPTRAEPLDAAPPLADGRYRLLSELGAGGMAIVYRGFDARLDVQRAIKVLSPEMAARPAIRQRFEVEARTMAKLQHPNIVSVQDVGVEGDRVYMVMELVESGSLMDRLEAGGPLSPVAACLAIEAILSALHVAHARGVVHRDIKPHNVLVTDAGTCKVTDFGIARVTAGEHAGTRTGTAMGTWAYMAPEQRSSAKHVDGRADLYAVAATFYVLLTLKEPFDLYAVEQHDEIFAGLLPELVSILKRGVRFKPEDRYATAAEMLEAVRQARYAIEGPSAAGTGRPRVEVDAALAGGASGLGEAMGVVTHTAVPGRLSGSETFAVGAGDPLVDAPASSSPSEFSFYTEPPRPERRWPLALGLGTAALVAIGVVVIGSGFVDRLAQQPSPVAVVSPQAAPPALAPAEVPNDPPPPVPTEASSPVAPPESASLLPAAVPEAVGPSRPSTVEKPVEKAATPKPVVAVAPPPVGPSATAFINSQPWARVTVDGRVLGDTFWKGTLSVGAHRVQLVTEDGRKQELSLTVAEGAPNRLCWDFVAEATCSR